MIFDKIENFGLYFRQDWVPLIVEELNKINSESEEGEFELYKDLIYYKIISYETKSRDWVTESHKKYVDVQIVLHGSEKIKVCRPDLLEIKTAYESKSDCVFYNEPNGSTQVSLQLTPGYFGVFFSDDAHTTQIASDRVEWIKKVVFKLDFSLFR